jgi:Ser/Thr protein kinase RdoA (MazF antagonist)
LARYPQRLQPIESPQSLGGAGGASGARLWRFRAAAGEMVLRAFPKDGPALEHLQTIHKWIEELSQDVRISVAVPLLGLDGRTIQQHEGRFWELTRWLPGSPELRHTVAADRVQAAFTALAAVHTRLSAHQRRGTSPGLRQRVRELESLGAGRLEVIAESLRRTGASTRASQGRRWVGLARAAVPVLLPSLRDAALLEIWLQPVLRDARPDHFLFDGDRLCGLIDFGAMGFESVAADLARMCGELPLDDHSLRSLALNAYQQVRALDDSEFALIAALQTAADVLIAAHWLIWYYLDHRVFDDASQVDRGIARGLFRLEHLIQRLEAGGPGILMGTFKCADQP